MRTLIIDTIRMQHDAPFSLRVYSVVVTYITLFMSIAEINTLGQKRKEAQVLILSCVFWCFFSQNCIYILSHIYIYIYMFTKVMLMKQFFLQLTFRTILIS